MNEREWLAMVNLLDDKVLSEEIKKQLLSMGISAIAPLELAWEMSTDAAVQTRVEDMLQFIQSEIALSELKSWRMRGGKDLLEGWFILTKFRYPKIELETYKNQISRLANIIWLDMEKQNNYNERILSVNYILYKKELFRPEKENINHPDRFYLKSFLDTKTGNSFSLSVLYLILTRALELPIAAYSIEGYLTLHFSDHDSDFYIDANNYGNFFHKKNLEKFVKEHFSHKDLEDYAPASNRLIIANMIEGLMGYYQEQQENNIIDYLNALLNVVK